jgi:hypothetical protein
MLGRQLFPQLKGFFSYFKGLKDCLPECSLQLYSLPAFQLHICDNRMHYSLSLNLEFESL